MRRAKKIIAVTGARSEYDLMFSVYKKLSMDETIEFGLIVVGPHLSQKFGYTVEQIIKDDFHIVDKIYNLIDSDEPLARITSIGNQIPLLANCISREKPDIVLVAGDREEAITVTTTCAYLGVVCAHFFGGDIAKDGNVDNSIRYAASKLANLHFVTLPEHKMNLIKMGEIPDYIFVVGNPALDRLKEVPNILLNEVQERIFQKKTFWKEYCVLIQHSIIHEITFQREHIRTTLDSILESNIPCFINFPNSDIGYSEIISAIEEYAKNYPNNFAVFRNLNRIDYVNLLKNSKFLIGNSSSGLLEAPSLKLAAINIGSRQRGRIHAENVIFVNNNKNDIKDAINFVLEDLVFNEQLATITNPYGDGNSSGEIVNILKSIELNDNLTFKNITY